MRLLFCHCCGGCFCGRCLLVFVTHRLAFMTQTLSARMLSLDIKVFEEKKRKEKRRRKWKKLHTVCAYVRPEYVCVGVWVFIFAPLSAKRSKSSSRESYTWDCMRTVWWWYYCASCLCNHVCTLANVELMPLYELYMACLRNNHSHDFEAHTCKCQWMCVIYLSVRFSVLMRSDVTTISMWCTHEKGNHKGSINLPNECFGSQC